MTIRRYNIISYLGINKFMTSTGAIKSGSVIDYIVIK